MQSALSHADPLLAVSGANGLHIASLEPVRLGMPELCRAGLSESWLFKACGHRHWLALAQAYGLARPDFRTADGARLYPAFTSVRLEGGQLDRLGEDDHVDFGIVLQRIGRTRFRSTIAVSHGERTVATLTLESAFVQRMVAGRNGSIARAPVARPCALLPPGETGGRRLRDRAMDGAGFDPAERSEIATCLIDPSPHEDFNGADFLYFAAFQAMADRAEWRWFHQAEPLLTTRRREIVYRGNIELGEQVRLTLCGVKQGAGLLDHWIEFRRAIDETLIATAVTHRRAVSAGPDEGRLERA